MDEKLVNAIVEQVIRKLGSSGVPPASLAGGGSVSDDIRAGKVMLGVSARHIHLTDEHVEILFGAGAKLTVFKPLHQPGEFAAEQLLTIVAPSGRSIQGVRILGPTRKTSQVEISLTDCYTLGLKKLPPIRPSGDHRDSVGLTLVGPAGCVTLKSGVIRANRHIHLSPAQAGALGLRDNDLVDVRVEGERPLTLHGCQVRAHPNFLAEMHLDTDDANAAGIRSGDYATILPPR